MATPYSLAQWAQCKKPSALVQLGLDVHIFLALGQLIRSTYCKISKRG
jgi:hypothetical protein